MSKSEPPPLSRDTDLASLFDAILGAAPVPSPAPHEDDEAWPSEEPDGSSILAFGSAAPVVVRATPPRPQLQKRWRLSRAVAVLAMSLIMVNVGLATWIARVPLEVVSIPPDAVSPLSAVRMVDPDPPVYAVAAGPVPVLVSVPVSVPPPRPSPRPLPTPAPSPRLLAMSRLPISGFREGSVMRTPRVEPAVLEGQHTPQWSAMPTVDRRVVTSSDPDVRTLPRLIDGPVPDYPNLGRVARIDGLVTLTLSIDAQGHVDAVRKATGPPLLRAAAEAAVQRWRYVPATINGQPVNSEIVVQFDFKR